ncbi:hypothetical protein [Sagittula sp. S175]|uniref:hypothetical protein n=1 Tax=Sagittula sp. S175 TaxID=3415129 RepID=UPI003C7A73D4
MMGPTTPALDPNALYAKSQVYIKRALIRHSQSEDEEYQLWASLSLELLGKSALATIHRSLVSDPTHFESLFAAVGLKASTDIKTITAKTLFQRLQKIIPAFDEKVEKFCNQVSFRRNSELHSGESPFAAIQKGKWEAEFWYSVEVVLLHMGKTLEDWLGTHDAKTPAEILEKARHAKTDAIATRIQRRKDEFSLRKRKDQESAIEESHGLSAWDFKKLLHRYEQVWEQPCPSCSADAFIGGNLVEEEILDQYGDEWSAWEAVHQYFVAEEFECRVCGLQLEGYDEISLAGIETSHVESAERELEYEPDYGND